MDLARLRHRLVVAFVVYHVCAVVLLSVPAPTGARSDEVWTDPFTRRQILGWGGWLVEAGVFPSEAALLERARAIAEGTLDLRDLVIAPFTPYSRAVGAGQGWQMFATLNDEPARLSLEVRWSAQGAWEPLYIARDPAHAWRIEQLDQERVRAFANDWSWDRDRADYKLFSRWLAREVAAEEPDAQAVRVSMLRAKLPTPEQLREGDLPPERVTWAEIIPLAPLRGQVSP